MKVQTNVKGGRIALNHNQTPVRGLAVQTAVKGGKLATNHNAAPSGLAASTAGRRHRSRTRRA